MRVFALACRLAALPVGVHVVAKRKTLRDWPGCSSLWSRGIVNLKGVVVRDVEEWLLGDEGCELPGRRREGVAGTDVVVAVVEGDLR